MTPKEAIFYGEYIKDGNGTRAALAAGFPEKSAHVAAARMLKKPAVAAAVDAWRKRQCARFEITAENVLKELARLAFYDPGKLFGRDGNLLPIAEMDDATRAAIASLDVEVKDTRGARSITKKVRMADKGTNLERLGKHLKLFGDQSFGATVEAAGGLPEDSTIKIVLVRPA